MSTEEAMAAFAKKQPEAFADFMILCVKYPDAMKAIAELLAKHESAIADAIDAAYEKQFQERTKPIEERIEALQRRFGGKGG